MGIYLSAVYALIVEDYGSTVNRHELRIELDKELAASVPEELDPNTWEASRQVIAEQNRFMAMAQEL